jgi:hypothetical protein
MEAGHGAQSLMLEAVKLGCAAWERSMTMQ